MGQNHHGPGDVGGGCELLLPAGEALSGVQVVTDWGLQQDRDPTHTATHPAVDKNDWPGLSCVKVEPRWPGNSPEVNNNHSAWGIFQGKVQRKMCTTTSCCPTKVRKGIETLSAALVRNMLQNKPERMQTCSARKAGKLDSPCYLATGPSTGVSIKKCKS